MVPKPENWLDQCALKIAERGSVDFQYECGLFGNDDIRRRLRENRVRSDCE